LRRPGERRQEERVGYLSAKLARKDEVIAELMEETLRVKKKSWPDLNGGWVQPDVRDEVIDYVREFPAARPRIISDNGPQFVARDFKEFIALCGMTHVRLHSAIGYVTPADKLAGRAEAILAERERKLEAARESRATMRRNSAEGSLTKKAGVMTIRTVGETEAGNAGERPARDSRVGRRASVTGARRGRALGPCHWTADAQSPSMPRKTPGSGAEPQNLVTAKAPDGPESLIRTGPAPNSG
jgi:hypothetical protein